MELPAVSGQPVVISLMLSATPQLVLAAQIVPPYAAGPPVHRHPGHTERCAVVQGTLALTIAGRTVMLHPGNALNIPPGAPHTFWNPTPGVTALLLIYAPGASAAMLAGLIAGEPPPPADPFLRYLVRA